MKGKYTARGIAEEMSVRSDMQERQATSVKRQSRVHGRVVTDEGGSEKRIV